METLTVVETAKLENLEVVVAGGLKSFVEVGRALLQIRDDRLYRATHMVFEEYCQERWDMSRQRASQLIGAAGVVDAVSTIVDTVPTNEAQVRPLTKLPEEERAAAWKEAVKVSKGKPTAAVVAQVVASRLPEANDQEEEESDDEPAPKRVELSKGEQESKTIRDEFLENLAKVCDGGVYTTDSIIEATGINRTSIHWFIRMCEVSPVVKVHRNYGRKGLVQFSFERTEAVTAHARIVQLAKQILDDPAGSARIQAAAGAIVSLLGG